MKSSISQRTKKRNFKRKGKRKRRGKKIKKGKLKYKGRYGGQKKFEAKKIFTRIYYGNFLYWTREEKAGQASI